MNNMNKPTSFGYQNISCCPKRDAALVLKIRASSPLALVNQTHPISLPGSSSSFSTSCDTTEKAERRSESKERRGSTNKQSTADKTPTRAARKVCFNPILQIEEVVRTQDLVVPIHHRCLQRWRHLAALSLPSHVVHLITKCLFSCCLFLLFCWLIYS